MTRSLVLNTNLAPKSCFLDVNTLSATSSDATAETGFQPFTPLDAALPPFPIMNNSGLDAYARVHPTHPPLNNSMDLSQGQIL